MKRQIFLSLVWKWQEYWAETYRKCHSKKIFLSTTITKPSPPHSLQTHTLPSQEITLLSMKEPFKFLKLPCSSPIITLRSILSLDFWEPLFSFPSIFLVLLRFHTGTSLPLLTIKCTSSLSVTPSFYSFCSMEIYGFFLPPVYWWILSLYL